MKDSNTDAGDRLIRLDNRTPIRFVGLFSILAVAYVLFNILWPLRWSLLALWVAVESMFFIFCWRPRYAELNKQPMPHKPKAVKAMKNFQRCLQYFRETPDLDIEMYYSGWFCGAKIQDIKRGNCEEFLAYAFWYSTVDELRRKGQGHTLSQMVDDLEACWSLRLAPGYTTGLKFMGHLWEPLKAQWRPLVFYMGTETLSWFACHMLERWGFQQYKHMGLSYFTLNMRSRCTAARSESTSSTISDLSVASVLSAIHSGASTGAHAGSSSQLSTSGTSQSHATKPGPAADLLACSAAPMPQSAEHRGTRTKSSPFQAAGLSWTAQLAADADFLAASIQSASAVHSTSPAVSQPTATPVQKRSLFNLRSKPAVAASSLDPFLSTHTSVMLKTMPNPLEDVFQEGLGAKDMPVLFLHGVGGLPAYLEMLLQVMALGHPLIVVQFNAVGMRLSNVDTADQAVDKVVGILDKLELPEACVIGHSYGTFVAGRLARLHSKRVHSLCLIDPVVFGMFMPQLLSNFLYKAPEWRGLHHLVDFAKRLAVYVAGHELHVCATFSRSFFWSDLNLWPEDLRPGTVVLLSGRDDLMNAQQVKDMLEQSGHVKVHFNKELTHGEFLIKSEVKQAIMEEVRGMLARSGSAVVGLARPVLETTMTLARTGLGVLGAMPAVQLHRGYAGSFVEDHANKLVRTFTGNLTAALQTVHSGKPALAATHSSSSSGSSSSIIDHAWSRIKSRQAACVAPSQVGTPGVHDSKASCPSHLTTEGLPPSAAAEGQGLASTMSLPVKRKTSKEKWIRSMLDNSSKHKSSSIVSKGMLPSAAASKHTAASHNHVNPVHLPKGVRLAHGREGRRSSGGGTPKRRVMVAKDGVEVVQQYAGSAPIPKNPEAST